MYRSVDAIARRTRLQQRRREQLLPPLASSSWSRIEAPAVPVSTPVEAMSSLTLDNDVRAVLQEAEDLLNEVPSLKSADKQQAESSSSDKQQAESSSLQAESSSAQSLDEELQAVLREADELLTDYGHSENEPADEYNDATLQAMVADINKQYKKIMGNTRLLRRSSRKAMRFYYLHSEQPSHQMVTRARRALVFDNNRDVCV
uniref:Maco-A 5 n=1 Tax=Mamestra configurata nucleopolyhedrovirus TaxID=207830 RepID=A0A5B9G8F6_NPVMC|nr:Maco-A 5 [Mamestra configurata nucleopolyhedrovirus A]